MKKNTQRKIKDPQNDNWEPAWRLATFQGIHITFGYVMKNIHKKLIAILCFWLLYKSTSSTVQNYKKMAQAKITVDGICEKVKNLRYENIIGDLAHNPAPLDAGLRKSHVAYHHKDLQESRYGIFFRQSFKTPQPSRSAQKENRPFPNERRWDGDYSISRLVRLYAWILINLPPLDQCTWISSWALNPSNTENYKIAKCWLTVAYGHEKRPRFLAKIVTLVWSAWSRIISL